MKSRPILFSAPMVRALLDGSKTQTRRIVKPQPEWTEPESVWQHGVGHSGTGWYVSNSDYPEEGALFYRCPYGQPGDQILVRETFFAWGRWETRFSAKKGRDEWHFVDMTLETDHAYCYAADGIEPAVMGRKRSGGVTPAWWKRPAIFMPRAASRITLEITGVRVERLQDISEADAIAEGCANGQIGPGGFAVGTTPREAYVHLWKELNGPDSWDLNPYVWVIEFNVKGAQ